MSEFSYAWKQLLRSIAINGSDEESRTGKMRELIGVGQFRLHEPEAFRLDAVPEVRELDANYAELFAELILIGATDAEAKVRLIGAGYQHVAKWLATENLPLTTSAMYGPRLHQQEAFLLQELAKPGSRRAIQHILLPEDVAIVDQSLSIEFSCTDNLQWFVRNNCLHLHVHMRSSSAIKLLPIDVNNFLTYAKRISKKIACPIAGFTMSFGSVHYFNSELEQKVLAKFGLSAEY